MLFWITCSSKARSSFNQFSLFWVGIALNVSIHPCWLAIWWCVCLICRMARGNVVMINPAYSKYRLGDDPLKTGRVQTVPCISTVFITFLSIFWQWPWPLFKAERLRSAPGTSAGHSAFPAGAVLSAGGRCLAGFPFSSEPCLALPLLLCLCNGCLRTVNTSGCGAMWDWRQWGGGAGMGNTWLRSSFISPLRHRGVPSRANDTAGLVLLRYQHGGEGGDRAEGSLQSSGEWCHCSAYQLCHASQNMPPPLHRFLEKQFWQQHKSLVSH